jgi:hypothetical protein
MSETTEKGPGKGFAGSLESNKRYIYDSLIKDGFTPQSAAGVLGNILLETGNLKYTTEISPNKNGQKGIGLLQWSGARATDFRSWLDTNKKSLNSISDNVEYLLVEMKKKTRHHWSNGVSYNNIKKMDTIQGATGAFMKGYLRPQADAAHEDVRLEYAKQASREIPKGPDGKPGVKDEVDPWQIQGAKKEDAYNIYKAENLFVAKDISNKMMQGVNINRSTMHGMDVSNIENATTNMLLEGDIGTEPKFKEHHDVAVNIMKSTVKSGILDLDIQKLNKGIDDEDNAYASAVDITSSQSGPSAIERATQMYKYGGFLQPNGRVSEFDRAEDKLAQSKTALKPSI